MSLKLLNMTNYVCPKVGFSRLVHYTRMSMNGCWLTVNNTGLISQPQYAGVYEYRDPTYLFEKPYKLHFAKHLEIHLLPGKTGLFSCLRDL